MNRVRGFTLLELMIVVAVIAILAAIAIPSYGQYAYRARRADGQNLLQHLATAQERFYSTNNRYSADPTNFGYAAGGATSEKGYYTAVLQLTNGGQGFVATATPVGAQASDKCGALSLDNVGAKQFSGSGGNGKCW